MRSPESHTLANIYGLNGWVGVMYDEYVIIYIDICSVGMHGNEVVLCVLWASCRMSVLFCTSLFVTSKKKNKTKEQNMK